MKSLSAGAFALSGGCSAAVFDAKPEVFSVPQPLPEPLPYTTAQPAAGLLLLRSLGKALEWPESRRCCSGPIIVKDRPYLLSCERTVIPSNAQRLARLRRVVLFLHRGLHEVLRGGPSEVRHAGFSLWLMGRNACFWMPCAR